MTLSYQHIFFLGIGGIAMSNLAKYCLSKNIAVSGYDKNQTHITDSLQSLGVNIFFDEHKKKLDDTIDLVVYTPAVPKDNMLFSIFQSKGLKIIKRSDLLQKITQHTFNISIAGTHGKTTISGMVAHMMMQTEQGCSAFVGGIMTNYDNNFLEKGQGNITITEADEYDRSFFKLHPNISVVTSIDPDHLDIYGNYDNLYNSFITFLNQTANDGFVILNQKLLSKTDILKKMKHKKEQIISYSLIDNNADVYTKDLREEHGITLFNIYYKGKEFKNVSLGMKGDYNVENALSCFSIGCCLNLDVEIVANALKTYRGIKRRFEYIINDDVVFIDDYAHHPSELKSCISSVRKLYPKKNLKVLFQPHLYTRTKDFYNGFAEALSLADDIIVLPIYPARELPIEGVESKIIVDKIAKPSCKLLSKEDAMKDIEKNKSQIEVLLTLGAGDIDKLVQPIKQILKP